MLAFLLLAGLTGSILAFRMELDTWLNHKLFKVEPKGQRATIDEAIAVVEARFTDTYVSTIILPQEQDDALKFYIKPKMEAGVAHVHVPGMKTTLKFNQVFVDPYAKVVLGQRNTAQFDLFSRQGFIPTMMRLHYTLFLDSVGLYTMGIVSLVWLLSTLVGVALSWPRTWHDFPAWRKILSVRWYDGAYKLNYSLHRSAGLIFLPVMLAVAFSGVYLNLPDMVKPIVHAFSNLTATPKGMPHPLEADRITPERAIEIALGSVPQARPNSMARSFGNGVYSVRLQLPDDVSPSGNNTAYIGMSDGKRKGIKAVATATAGDTFLYWLQPLHSGRAFGLTGQILIALGGLVLTALGITGIAVWLRKRAGEKKRRDAGSTLSENSGLSRDQPGIKPELNRT